MLAKWWKNSESCRLILIRTVQLLPKWPQQSNCQSCLQHATNPNHTQNLPCEHLWRWFVCSSHSQLCMLFKQLKTFTPTAFQHSDKACSAVSSVPLNPNLFTTLSFCIQCLILIRWSPSLCNFTDFFLSQKHGGDTRRLAKLAKDSWTGSGKASTQQ